MNSSTAFPKLMTRSYLSRSQPRTYRTATPTKSAVAAKKMMSSMSTFLRSGIWNFKRMAVALHIPVIRRTEPLPTVKDNVANSCSESPQRFIKIS